MAFIKSNDGLNIFYEHFKGNKGMPTLCFVHGWAVDWTFFGEIINFFQKKGYGILYFDLRGHGKTDSPKDVSQADLNLIVEDLKGILFKEKVEKIILVGHSMGGMVSLLFALKYQEMVNKLIVMNSYYQSPLKSPLFKFLKGDTQLAKKIVDKVVSNTKSKQVESKLDFSKMQKRLDLDIFAKAMNTTSVHDCFLFVESMLNYNVEDKLEDIKVHTLIINSSNDQFFTIDSSKYMAQKMPNAVCRIFKGTHSLPLKQPEMISKEIELFII